MGEKLYTYMIGFENGSPDGIHEHGSGSWETIEKCAMRHFTEPFFVEQDDGTYLIYRCESEAQDSNYDPVGVVREVQR